MIIGGQQNQENNLAKMDCGTPIATNLATLVKTALNYTERPKFWHKQEDSGAKEAAKLMWPAKSSH